MADKMYNRIKKTAFTNTQKQDTNLEHYYTVAQIPMKILRRYPCDCIMSTLPRMNYFVIKTNRTQIKKLENINIYE